MHSLYSIPLISFMLPLSAVLAGLVLLPTLVTSLMRAQATRIALATVLLTLLAGGALLYQPGAELTQGHYAMLALMCVAACLMAAPLLDRGRTVGAVFASCVGGISAFATAALALEHFPIMEHVQLLPVTFLTALLVALTGSALLPMSPLRHDASGAVRVYSLHPGQQLAGWVLLALSMLLIARYLNPHLPLLLVLCGGLVSALLVVMTSRLEDTASLAGAALCAGILITLTGELAPQAAAIAGCIAAFTVSRGPALTQSLRLDDPLGCVGALLLPLLLGMFMPVAVDFSMGALATTLRQLGFILGAATAISVFLWPITLVFFGLALPTRLVREGVRR